MRTYARWRCYSAILTVEKHFQQSFKRGWTTSGREFLWQGVPKLHGGNQWSAVARFGSGNIKNWEKIQWLGKDINDSNGKKIYRIVKEIAKGSYGQAFDAQHHLTGYWP